MLLRSVDTHDAFDDEPRPDGEWTETALANWKRVADARGKRLFPGQPLRAQRGLRGCAPGDMTATLTRSNRGPTSRERREATVR